MQEPVLESLEERAMWMRESVGVLYFTVLIVAIAAGAYYTLEAAPTPG